MSTTLNKPKEEHPETHINQTDQNQRQRENLESSQGKETNNIQGNPDKVITGFFSRNSAARREWHDILNVMKGKNLQPRLLYPARLSFRFEGEIKSFIDKQKLREFSNTKPALQQILKELPQAEKKRPQPETKIPQMTRLTSKGIYTVKI